MDYALLLADPASGQEASRRPRQRQLYEALRAAILNGKLAPGARLLSSRELAQTLGIARNAVLYAYERLGDEGLLRADRQGSCVARLGLPTPGPGSDARDGVLPGLSQRVGVLHGLPRSGRTRAFAPGVPALDEFPVARWRASVDRAWRVAGHAELGYGDSAGHPALRRAIADHLRLTRGVRCEPRQVFVTDGIQGGLDLCASLLADEGELAWMEHPGYLGAYAAFRRAGLRILPVPVDRHGMNAPASLWRRAPPRLVYVTPSHQYPVGGVLSLARRAALLDAARSHGAWLIEDDYDSEFHRDGQPLPAIQGLDAQTPAVYLGTFSKTLFPALRLGYVVMPASLADDFARVAGGVSRQGRLVEQSALADFIERGEYGRHLRRMRRLYAQRCAALGAALQRHLGAALALEGAAGGMHLCAHLHGPCADDAIERAAAAEGLIVPALSGYGLPGAMRPAPGLVLGYANVPAEQADALAARLAQVIEQTLAPRTWA